MKPTHAPTFIELYSPKLLTVLREGYRLGDLKADMVAGLTVAIVALPLSMAIAIASGVTPDRGLYTAIVGGFIISALGGSRFQIGGPAGAFIVLVATTVALHGVDGLLLATMISGLILLAIGFLRLGTFIKYIPYPVTVGFTAGIAVIIFASQVHELLGLTLSGAEPGPIIPKVEALVAALPTFNAAAIGVAALSIGAILVVRRFRPTWPGFLIAVALASVLAWLFHLPVETIGTRFGGIPALAADAASARSVAGENPGGTPCGPVFRAAGRHRKPALRRRRRQHERPPSPLQCRAGGARSGQYRGTLVRRVLRHRYHRPHRDQCARRRARAGVRHAACAVPAVVHAGGGAPLASYIPLAALAGILAIVSWNMAEKHEFGVLLRASRGDAIVLLATFLLVVFRDLTEGILVGFGLGALLFLHRMAQAVAVDRPQAIVEGDVADTANGNGRRPYDSALASDPDVAVHRISGAFFFGAAASVGAALDRIGAHPKAHVIDVSSVPVLDSTAAITIEGFARKARRHGAFIYVAGADPKIRRVLLTHGVRPPMVRFRANLADAVAAARKEIAGKGRAEAGSPDLV